VRLFDDDDDDKKNCGDARGCGDSPTGVDKRSGPENKKPGEVGQETRASKTLSQPSEKKMSPEQNALVCGFVSFLAATFLACCAPSPAHAVTATAPSVLPAIDLTVDSQALASFCGEHASLSRLYYYTA
jgi:hypothetical protein